MRAVLSFSALLLSSGALAAATLDEAREHLQKGRYEEAIEAFGELTDEESAVEVALLHSRALEETGKWDEVAKVVDDALADDPKDVRLIARRAELHLKRGEFAEAEKLAEKAIGGEPDQLLARWVLAQAQMETGRLAEAEVGYRWFVRYYNRVQPEDAASLLHVADGALQYARWRSSSSIFRFVVNDLCPDALKDDDQSWQAWHVSGRTLLEKYNRAQAKPEFDEALAINPRAADVLVSVGELAMQKMEFEDALAKAEEALKVNPAHPRGLRLKSDALLQSGKVGEAIAALQLALKVNPHDQRTLARLAVCYVLVDGSPKNDRLVEILETFGEKATATIEPDGRLERLFADVAEYNRRPGYLLSDLGEGLDGRRKYGLAEAVYRHASRVNEKLSEPKVGLGMLCMRIGRVDDARTILDSAFKLDPFHVRVSNTRKVLKVLAEYETIETDHFVVQFDGEKDRVLGEAMAAYLEEIYPVYTELYGFEPPFKTRFEVYNEKRGIDGHGWFSARMVGLPWIQTIGATTGQIVAFASPTAVAKPYNWARVCRHEFVHVLTLQKTEFNIPHWFTEALAVASEGYPRPPEWNAMLLERVPKRDLKDLSNLTDGFTRPDNLREWTFAYCQSKLYRDYMQAEFGDESIRRLLAEYEVNRTTAEAVPDVFGVDLATFEKGYLDYLDGVVAKLRGGATDSRTNEEIEKAYEENPDDPATAGAYARVRFEADEFADAREVAETVLAKEASQVDAAVVLAKLELRARDTEAAIAVLKPALDEDAPDRGVLETLAKATIAADDDEEAARLFELGIEAFPDDPKWVKGLAAVHQKSGAEPAVLKQSLARVANTVADDPDTRIELARLCLDDEEYADALEWATRAMHITAQDPAVHRLRAEAFTGLGRDEDAEKATATAESLEGE